MAKPKRKCECGWQIFWKKTDVFGTVTWLCAKCHPAPRNGYFDTHVVKVRKRKPRDYAVWSL